MTYFFGTGFKFSSARATFKEFCFASPDSAVFPGSVLSHTFFGDVCHKALCVMTKAPSVEDNEGSGQECAPSPGSPRSIQPGGPTPLHPPPRCEEKLKKKKNHKNKTHAVLKHQVTVCVSHSLYHRRTSVCRLVGDRQTEPGSDSSVCFRSDESHPLISAAAHFGVIAFNDSYYYCQICSVMTHLVQNTLVYSAKVT